MLTFAFDNCWCRVLNATPEIISTIKKRCSYREPGYQYKSKWYQMQHNGYISVFVNRTNAFPTGMMDEVLNEISEPYEVIDERITYPPEEEMIHTLHLRPYQQDAVNSASRFPRGSIQSPTGSGKTHMMIALACKLGMPTLFITNKVDMLNQLQDEISKAIGEHCGIIGNSIKDIQHFTVATIQTLALMEQREVNDFFRVLIIDEFHHSACESYLNTLLPLSNIYYRYGFTATVNRNDDAVRILSAVTGSLIHNVQRQILVDEGYIVTARITMITVNSEQILPMPEVKIPENVDAKKYVAEQKKKHETMAKKKFGSVIYPEGIVNNAVRNQIIVSEARRLLDNNETVLILVSRVEHGYLLAEMGNFIFLSGKDNSKNRNVVKSLMKNGEVKCVITTSIWKEGVDVPAMSALIVAEANKSPIGVVQSVGRVIRPVEGKKYATVIDFMDRQNIYLLNQSKQRMKTYRENGWEIEVI